MKQLLLALLLIPTFLFAQNETDEGYLEGAVPMIDGKVVFSRDIQVPSSNQEAIFRTLTDWGEKTFKTGQSRMAYSNIEKGEIAIVGEEYLVFKSTLLSLDRTLVKFNLIINCSNQRASLQFKSIRYEYNLANEDGPLKFKAEEWITDKYALNKKKDKLYRNMGKFRKATIDYANKIFDAAEVSLGVKQITIDPLSGEKEVIKSQKVQTETVAPAKMPIDKESKEKVLAPTKEIVDLVQFDADKIPTTIIDILPDNKAVLQTTTENISDQDIVWKGIGTMFGKKISTVSISKASAAYQAMQSDKIYRISFHKPNDTSKQPWMILECNKQGETIEGNNVLIIGEITNVWIK